MRVGLYIFLLFTPIISTGQVPVFGLGLANGTLLGSPGVNISAGMIKDEVAFDISFTKFFRKEWDFQSNELNASSWIIDFEALIYIVSPEKVASLFILVGMNHTKYTGDIVVQGSPYYARRIAISKTGLNIGGGANFGKGSFVPFVELKYQTGTFSQGLGIAGVKYKM